MLSFRLCQQKNGVTLNNKNFSLPKIRAKLSKKYLLGSKQSRLRKISPEKLFIILLHLVTGKNNEGYLHALSSTWQHFESLKRMPAKSSLAKARSRVSWQFFKDIFFKSVEAMNSKRKTWRGLHIYAIDGDQFELPYSEDLIGNGYDGHPSPEKTKTYLPRMYAVTCCDVLSGSIKDFCFSKTNDEVASAVFMANLIEKNSLILYDRLFFGRPLMDSHINSGSYFLARVRSGNHFPEVMRVYNTNAKNGSFEYKGVVIHVIKIIHPKTKDVAVYCTNLPRDKFRNREIADLYALRWEVETANRTFTDTLKAEQWHSKSENGILQEIYTLLWFVNQVRMQMADSKKRSHNLAALFEYTKANFKLISDVIINGLDDLINNRPKRLISRIKILIRKSKETRSRRSRSYPRQTRHARQLYNSASLIPRQP